MSRKLGHFLFVVIFLVTISGVIGQWYLLVGFDPLDRQWWQWLAAVAVHPAGLPKEMQTPAIWTLIAGMMVMIINGMLMSRARNDTVAGGRSGKELYGSARWATLKDIRKARLFRKNGVVIGGVKTRTGKVRELRHNGPEHVLAFAPTRTGKGVSIILPTLLSWQHSTIVLDIKGENFAKTAGWREARGQRVCRFDPTNPEACETVRFNPLSEVRVGTRRDIADCQNIASMVIDPDGKGLSDYWRQEGWGWLSVVLLHVIYKVGKEENRIANFDDVNIFLSGISTVKPPAEALEAAREGASREVSDDQMSAQDNFVKILEAMAEYDHGLSHVNKEVQRGANSLAIKAPQERSGVHSNAKTQLTLYADPIIAENTAVSDFRLDDLMNGKKPMSLYLVFSPADIDRLRPLIRIMMNLFLRRLTEKMDYGDGMAKAGYKHRLLLMLDEFPAIGKLEIFERALAFMAGYGIKAYIIIQNIEQLRKEYGKDESIFPNCDVRTAFTPNQHGTAELLSKIVGKQTIIQQKRSASGKQGKMSVSNSDSIHEMARDLMTPDEIMRLPKIDVDEEGKTSPVPGDALILVAGRPPIYGRQRLYFLDQELSARSKVKPPAMNRSDNSSLTTPITEKTHEAA